MTDGGTSQHELGVFLRTKRETASRTEAGLPPIRRRTTGLRREEVAILAGISVTWYTWLEQGRAKTSPSRQVLDSVAATLGLRPAEHAFVLSLAGYSEPYQPEKPDAAAAPPNVQRLLDAQGVYPSYAVSADWTIVAWNATYSRFYPPVTGAQPSDRNLLWLTFTDPYLRSLVVDWENDSRRVIAEFRAEMGARLGTPPVRRLVGRLCEVSPEFRDRWAAHQVSGFTTRLRHFRHPEVGELLLEHHRMTTSDDPKLHLVIYVPDLGSGSIGRLRRLHELAVPQARPGD
ncbi:helix-turn-helix transcriptional regulator [Lentzea sp. JNUCC 0626]|uniref:helix-turn-helix transcriptional regulator n=1 Tax=Lentzea sp. JNUCC 0626 TaxID=3367513 RepID=UPI00374A7F00